MENKGIFILNKDIGGSSVVAKVISKHLDLKLQFLDERPMPDKAKYIFSSQPKSLLFCLRYLNAPLVRFILDTHPSALPRIKRFCYLAIVLALFVCARKRTFIPIGPLSDTYSHKYFKAVEWSQFVTKRFTKTTDECQKFVFLGQPLRAKGFNIFDNISSAIPKLNLKKYQDQLSCNNIYFWWGLYDSYGLLWREIASSKLSILCCRTPSRYDNISHAMYFSGLDLATADIKLVQWHTLNFTPEIEANAEDNIVNVFS